MVNLSKVSIHSDEIVGFLKESLQFKGIYQSILYQRIILESAAERGLTVTPEEIQAEANRQRYTRRLEKASETLAWLADEMIAVEDWEAGIQARLLAKKLSEALLAQEVEKFFAQNRIDFEQVLLYQIIVEDGNLAQEIFYQIEEQEISFYEAAHLYDKDEKRRQQCGFEGKLYRWNLPPDIVAVVFGSPLGEVISPIKTDLGYHLLMVEAFIPAELTPERYQEILENMFKEWLARELNYKLHAQTV
ncbi:MAG TPA: peptidylprolyl isomerase [Coleofasciculaceae cyanobacterium]